MDRNCSKCVHHTSGSCSKWECMGTVTIKDVKEEALNDLLDSIKNGDDYPQFVACGLEMGNCGYQIPYDMAEHERIIRADALAEVEEAMYHQCFECDNDEDMQKWESGNWLRYKLFENVMEQLKGQSNDRARSN